MASENICHVGIYRPTPRVWLFRGQFELSKSVKREKPGIRREREKVLKLGSHLSRGPIWFGFRLVRPKTSKVNVGPV